MENDLQLQDTAPPKETNYEISGLLSTPIASSIGKALDKPDTTNFVPTADFELDGNGGLESITFTDIPTSETEKSVSKEAASTGNQGLRETEKSESKGADTGNQDLRETEKSVSKEAASTGNQDLRETDKTVSKGADTSNEATVSKEAANITSESDLSKSLKKEATNVSQAGSVTNQLKTALKETSNQGNQSKSVLNY